MKKTKILATLGPASNSVDVIRQMVEAGANAFRINTSHGSKEQWAEIIKNVREVSRDVAIILDTKGPEIRITNIHEEMSLSIGQHFAFHNGKHDTMPYLTQKVNLEVGQKILFDDGAICMEVKSLEGDIVHTYVHNEGSLTDRRKVTIPNAQINLPVLTEGDEESITFARDAGLDGIALSFTQTADDVKLVRELSDGLMIIAKIENRTGVDNQEKIAAEADGIMIARGDLGVEMPLSQVPIVQKSLINLCNDLGKPVIVATQMLESMIEASIPTRAEASDIANAILDGADCIMLSAESAVGNHPVLAISTMSQIANETDGYVQNTVAEDAEATVDDAISHAVFDLSLNLEIDNILCATSSGATARKVARYRPNAPIIGISEKEETIRRLQLTWGVIPCFFEEREGHQLDVLGAVKQALECGVLSENDMIIATAGIHTMKSGSTNLIEVHKVADLLCASDC